MHPSPLSSISVKLMYLNGSLTRPFSSLDQLLPVSCGCFSYLNRLASNSNDIDRYCSPGTDNTLSNGMKKISVELKDCIVDSLKENIVMFANQKDSDIGKRIGPAFRLHWEMRKVVNSMIYLTNLGRKRSQLCLSRL